MIQNSILKQNNLKKLIVISYLNKVGSYFNKWRTKQPRYENNPPFQNQFIIEKLLSSNNIVNNFILEKKSSSINKDNDYDMIPKSGIIGSKERCLSRIFSTKLKDLYSNFFNNMKISILKNKIKNAFLSLFITHSNAKIKLKRVQYEVNLN